jgi:hypothetical protein
MQRQADEVGFAAVSIASDRQPLTAPSGTCGAIEIEFAAGARMRITGAVNAATLSAAKPSSQSGRPEASACVHRAERLPDVSTAAIGAL